MQEINGVFVLSLVALVYGGIAVALILLYARNKRADPDGPHHH
jgi:hypothetical protein